MNDLLSLLLSTIPPHEQVWGETEDMAVVVLLLVGVVLTLAVAGVFIYILTREQDK